MPAAAEAFFQSQTYDYWLSFFSRVFRSAAPDSSAEAAAKAAAALARRYHQNSEIARDSAMKDWDAHTDALELAREERRAMESRAQSLLAQLTKELDSREQARQGDVERARSRAVRRVLEPNYDCATRLMSLRNLRSQWHRELLFSSADDAFGFLADENELTLEEARERFGQLSTDEMNRMLIPDLWAALMTKRASVFEALGVPSDPVELSPRSWQSAEPGVSVTRVLADIERVEEPPAQPKTVLRVPAPQPKPVRARRRLLEQVQQNVVRHQEPDIPRHRRNSLNNIQVAGSGRRARHKAREQQATQKQSEAAPEAPSLDHILNGMKGARRMSMLPRVDLCLRRPEAAPCFMTPILDLTPKDGDTSPSVDPAVPLLAPVTPIKARRRRAPVQETLNL